MAGDVTDLDAFRPHLRVSGSDQREYVLPVNLIQDVVDGKMSVSYIPEAVWRTVAREWLVNINKRGG